MGLAGKDVAMQVACMTTDNLKYDQMNVIYLDMRGGWWNSGYVDICKGYMQDNVGHEYTDMDNGQQKEFYILHRFSRHSPKK